MRFMLCPPKEDEMMENLSASPQEWGNLYTAAIEFKKIEPWQWMDDTDLLGVQNPENGEIGYCCVLGALGEFYGLAVYLGTEGLNVELRIHSGEIRPEDREVTYIQKCLLASFADRKYLQKEDLDVIKQLGLKFRGPSSWPSFRSYQPGYYPWYLDRKEVAFFTLVLQQTKEVALRFKANRNLFHPPGKDLYFVRVPERRGTDLIWEDGWLRPAPLEEKESEIQVIDELRLQRIRKKTLKSQGTWEIDFFHIPAPVKEDARPFYPYVFLSVDHDTGIILKSHLEKPDQYKMKFLDQMLDLIEELGCLPREVMVQNEKAFRLYEPVASKLGFRLMQTKKLREVGRARKSMEALGLSGKR